ncbi:MAG: penicillin-binding protein 2 [Kiritimatiellae bacterium]|nr:penicillin-binding protein 2 [Kiritimatiellia bacterium]
MSAGDSLAGRLSCCALAMAFIVGLLHLAVRLREVQVVEAADYGYILGRQAERRVQTGGTRGRIFDRNGSVLADNRESVSIICRPSFFKKRTWDEIASGIIAAISNVESVVGRPSPVTAKDVRRHIARSLAMPLPVWRDVDDGELARFSERESEFPGFAAEVVAERVYPQRRLAAHLLGYVGRDRGESVAGDEKFNFFLPELRGRSGIEHYYDGFLIGVPGERKLLVDARGFTIREWTVVEAKKGPDLRLTIDSGVQRAVERQLRGEIGACVVLDPRNGEVLAMASAPGFDPNDFVPVLRTEVYERFAGDPSKPLLNRATGGAFAPGSTFKPITALAGLRAGYPETAEYNCDGVYQLGMMRIHCARRWGHGELDLRRALMKSCNPFFCNLGMDIGTNALIAAARDFGLGRRTGVDFGVDSPGVVPDGEWKLRKYREKWFQGDLAQMSIGQGMLLVTPLQMAMVAGAIGTGYSVMPHLKADMAPVRRPLPFAAAHLRAVREGMRMVVAGDGESGGSGWRGGEGVPVPVSGKTGTAEVGRRDRRRNNTWFIAYAPSEAPRVAVAMLIEDGVSGGGTAAPKVAEILKAVFNDG